MYRLLSLTAVLAALLLAGCGSPLDPWLTIVSSRGAAPTPVLVGFPAPTTAFVAAETPRPAVTARAPAAVTPAEGATATPLPAPAQAAIPAGWHEFTSTRHGYAVGYPDGWQIDVQQPAAASPGKDAENVFLHPSAAALPVVSIYALKEAPPLAGYENCARDLGFQGVQACTIRLPKGQNPVQELLVFQKGESYYALGVQYDQDQQLASFQAIIRTFRFTSPVAEASPTARVAVNWTDYRSTGGAYSLRYPANFTFYEEQVPGVDGVLAAAPHTIALRQAAEGDVLLSIAFKPIDAGVDASTFAGQDDACVAKTGSRPFALAGEKALLFVDTPCGPYGSSVVYATHGRLGYRVEIVSSTGYERASGWVEAILSTFEFLPARER